MRSRKNQKQRERGHRHRSGGGIDSSVCQTLKTQEECVVCKWNAKTAKCGKAPVKRVPKEAKDKAKPKRVPKAKSGCPVLDKESCDSNPDCLWNAKTKKCRKHAVKKARLAANLFQAIFAMPQYSLFFRYLQVHSSELDLLKQNQSIYLVLPYFHLLLFFLTTNNLSYHQTHYIYDQFQ